jgi:hypothetical protein
MRCSHPTNFFAVRHFSQDTHIFKTKAITPTVSLFLDDVGAIRVQENALILLSTDYRAPFWQVDSYRQI